jgi:hypothetical protein
MACDRQSGAVLCCRRGELASLREIRDRDTMLWWEHSEWDLGMMRIGMLSKWYTNTLRRRQVITFYGIFMVK